MTVIARLQSVQVGAPSEYPWHDPANPEERSWRTSFVREPSPDRRWLHTTHLDGNAQADTKNHGTLDKAVLLYDAAHYPRWQAELDWPEIGPGGFAENFTLDGLSEATACAGDVYEVGEALVQVTGPRYPCYKIGRRWHRPDLTDRVIATGRTGWYCRVLREGWIEPGLPLTLVDRPYPAVTMALLNDLGHGRNRDLATAREVADCPALPPFWQRLVVKRAQGRDA